MSHELDRRDFLKTAGVLSAGAVLHGAVGGCAHLPAGSPAAGSLAAVPPGEWAVKPFALTQVRLGPGIFQQKRDRMLAYARTYGGEGDIYAGPDRMLRNFRATAGLDTRGAEPPGSWDNGTGYLRGHYSGHFMSMLAQAFAGTGDDLFKRKLDYMVAALAECQDALAAAARLPTPRSEGRFGRALRLSGTPLGLAEHVALPAGLVSGLRDFTIATWIRPGVYDRAGLPDASDRLDPAVHNNNAVIFDFGRPNDAYGEPPLARMFLTVRVSNDLAVPRFAITTAGAEGEQRVDGVAPLAIDAWTHVAVTGSAAGVTLFVNGVAVANNPNLSLRPADLGETTGNWLGRCQFPQRNVSYLNARLDEFQIWDRALQPEEVRSLLESAGGSAGGGNVAWYRFDESDGPEARDASGRGRHATIIAPTDGRRHAGFLSAYPETPFIRLEEFATYGGNQGIWAPYYTLHKILAGLLDANALAGNTQALEIAGRIGDWVHSRLGALPQRQLDRMWNIYIAGEYGGINESLATLHARLGRPQHLEAARRFTNTVVYDAVATDKDILDGRHANQHIPQFTGYLRLYEQSREPAFFEAANNFWDMVVPHRTYSHGGVGVGEIFRARDVIAGSLYQFPRDANHAETCPLYNMLKLSRNLFFHEPDPKYMNYYEQGLFNQILGSRRDADSSTSPEVTYFVPVRPGQRRRYGNTGTCCGGTGMENHTKYQDSIWFRSADDHALYVNLYIPSTLDWREKGFTIEQTTRYPFEGASHIAVNGSGPLDILLRVPAWARRGFIVRINGSEQRLDAVPGRYVTLRRTWKPGDVIDIAMPFSVRVERAIDDPSVQSLFYGPNLLAVQNEPLGETLETGLLELELYRHMKLDGDLAPALTPAAAPLHFTLGERVLVPFHEADPQPGNTMPYHLYFRRREPNIVFASRDSGVPNRPRPADRLTFLDVLWDRAPFASAGAFTAAVQATATEWERLGLVQPNERSQILQAANSAARELEG